MKNILTLISATLLFATTFAQIEKGYVKYSLEFTSDNPEVQTQLSMMQGSTTSIYFTPNFTRTEMNMGMIAQTTNIFDVKKKKMLMLMSGMMGKKYAEIDLNDVENLKDDSENNIKVVKTKDTKKIAGYECQKYVVTDNEGNTMNFWSTNEIEVSKAGMKFMNNEVEGFPLKYEIAQKGMTMVFTAIEIKDSLNGKKESELFLKKAPAGYVETSIEDLKKIGM